jgi:hypothetical protein
LPALRRREYKCDRASGKRAALQAGGRRSLTPRRQDCSLWANAVAQGRLCAWPNHAYRSHCGRVTAWRRKEQPERDCRVGDIAEARANRQGDACSDLHETHWHCPSAPGLPLPTHCRPRAAELQALSSARWRASRRIDAEVRGGLKSGPLGASVSHLRAGRSACGGFAESV